MFLKGILVIFCLVLVEKTLSSSIRCGCFQMCDKKYGTKEKGLITVVTHERAAAACRGGCRMYHQFTRIPRKKGKVAGDSCNNLCGSTYDDVHEQLSCMDGCRNGCEYSGVVPSRLRVTIFVEDDLPDIADADDAVNEPALRKQLEIISHPGEKTKIPASYFTNLPRVRKPGAGCTLETHICEGLVLSEPVIVVALLILFAAVLYHTFWRRPSSQRLEYSPLTEKPPINFSV